MEKLKIVTIYEKVLNSMVDKTCNEFIDYLETVIENSKWKDIVTFSPEE